MLALTGLKLYSLNSFPLLQMTPLILPTVSLAAEKKTFRVMLLPLVVLANNGCAIDRTGLSSNSNRLMLKGSRPFYWILIKKPTCNYLG